MEAFFVAVGCVGGAFGATVISAGLAWLLWATWSNVARLLWAAWSE